MFVFLPMGRSGVRGVLLPPRPPPTSTKPTTYPPDLERILGPRPAAAAAVVAAYAPKATPRPEATPIEEGGEGQEGDEGPPEKELGELVVALRLARGSWRRFMIYRTSYQRWYPHPHLPSPPASILATSQRPKPPPPPPPPHIPPTPPPPPPMWAARPPPPPPPQASYTIFSSYMHHLWCVGCLI